MRKLNRLAIVLGGSACLMYWLNIWLLLFGRSMLPYTSNMVMLVFAYLCITAGGSMVIYGYKVNLLLTKVINSSLKLQEKMPKDKAKDKVKSVIKNRRILRIGALLVSPIT